MRLWLDGRGFSGDSQPHLAARTGHLVQFVAFMTVAHSMLLAALLIFVIAARDLKRRGLL
jgi:hypothetical protein